MISYGKQSVTQNDIDAVISVLKSDFWTQGPVIQTFETAFANYVGAKYAVAVANGTAALHLCALALGVQKGDGYLTTPITFAASGNCILYCGGKIDFIDIVPETYMMDIDALEDKLKNAPQGTYKGIISVDFAGYPADLARIKTLAEEYNLSIIEDACHAPGGYFIDNNETQQRCGNGQFADLAIFSFHPVKHIAAGEGGIITTNDDALYQKLLLFRTHGITRNPDLMHENQGGWYQEMLELGYNYRLSEIHAALGYSQLLRAAEGLERRQQIAQRYDVALADLPLQLPQKPQNGLHAFHLYVIRTQKRKELYDYLRTQNIACQVHYLPMHLHPYYQQQFGWKKGDFPQAEAYYAECLSLPMYPTLSEEELEYVIEKVSFFYKKKGE